MSDNIEENQQQIHTEQEEQQTESDASTTMTEIEKSETTTADETQKKPPMNISFSIWPPTQRTRDAVIHRLIETLTTPSILAKRYGTVPHDEASEAAKRIEEEAFASAGSSTCGDDDGVEILQVYSKEISRRMLDAVKSRSAAAVSVAEGESKPSESAENAAAEASSSPVENES